MAASSSSSSEILPKSWQVFINFRGAELRDNFISHLEGALALAGIKYYIDTKEVPSEDLSVLFERIEQSEIALSIFSSKVTEYLNGISKASGAENVDTFSLGSYEFPYSSLEISVTDVDYGMTPLKRQAMIDELCRVGGEHLNDISTLSSNGNISSGHIEQSPPHYGIELRLKELEGKIQFDCVETMIVGIVGMPGIGKTTLAETLYRKWEHKFERSMFFPDVSKMASQPGLQKRLLEELLKDIHYKTGYTENEHEFCKDDLLEKKVFVVIDDVSSKEQLKSLFGQCDWIKKGSKIVITSSDKSLLKELVDDTYVVPRLNSRDSLLWFTNHAFGLDDAEGNFVKLSTHFLNYAKGNPLVLRAFGVELRGKDEAYWEQRIGTLAQSSNKMIQYVLRKRYDELTERQKDAFLDVACFFKSENVSYVRCLVNSCESKSTMVWHDIRDLQDKFLVNISGGRVEMHDIVCTFAKEIASQALTEENTKVHLMLRNYQDIICWLKNKLEMKNVRGIFLDMSEVPEETIFDSHIFSKMCNLRYLKICTSACPKQGEGIFTFDIYKEIRLPLHKVRYLHWMKYPWEKLPSDFNPKNLVDLELPYSSIKQVWVGVKDTPKLKWANLSYSSKLTNLLGLSNAKNLERLNLEGCTSLLKLPQEMENMKSLVFLNMRRCTSLTFLQRMNMSSLKILILSEPHGTQGDGFLGKSGSIIFRWNCNKGTPSSHRGSDETCHLKYERMYRTRESSQTSWKPESS
ncbi:predicted protein [Arabidopsis lyrata subsp. lyrata]|uniref:Predicted protein n=1 Tax=Arabidopsis lyrata subsp. lyrata TaxID=81972 RepID=D7MLF6_ARALL|nr:predicted protein [Arabidopsis lyrata subsp. lyrata]